MVSDGSQASWNCNSPFHEKIFAKIEWKDTSKNPTVLTEEVKTTPSQLKKKKKNQLSE
jgi:hypothetical protein